MRKFLRKFPKKFRARIKAFSRLRRALQHCGMPIHRLGVDDDVLFNLLRPDDDRDAERAQFAGKFALARVTAAHLDCMIVQDLCERAHTYPADPDKIDAARRIFKKGEHASSYA